MSTVVLNASPRKAGSKAQGVATNAPTPGSPHQTKTKRGAADTAASTPGSTPARVRLKTASTPSSTSKGGHASDIAHAWATGFNRSHLTPPNPHAPYELANIIKPHVESFNFAVEKGGALDQAVALLPAQTIEADPVTHRPSVRFWLAEIQIGLPRKSDDSTDVRLFPNECREGGRSYTAPLIATVNRSVGGGAPTQVTVSLGELPIMVRSKKCHLHGLTRDQLIARREEGTEMGGYFIINGNERLIRLLIVPRRNHVTALVRPSFGNRDAGFTEFACTIRCVRPDQSAQSLTLHYLSDGTSRLRFTFRKQEFFVPSYVLLRALVDSARARSTTATCCAVGAFGSSVPGKGKKAWRRLSTVASSRPTSRRWRSVTIWKPPGTRIGLAMAPGGICASTRCTAGSTASAPTQPRSPPASALCAWLNWVAATGKGTPARSCATISSTKRRTSGSSCLLYTSDAADE